MSCYLRTGRLVPTLVLAALLSAGLVAQTAKPDAPSASKAQASTEGSEKPPMQLRVQVTISRYAGEKKVTSLPFTLWVTTSGDTAILNVGQAVTPPGWTTQNVGTSITCRASPTVDGRLRLLLTVSDSYLSPAKEGPFAFKSLQANNLLYLRDGQTAEFAASTDLVTGEVTRIEVTATVLK